MPLYNYKCKKCGRVAQDVQQSIKDEQLTSCDQLEGCPEDEPGEINRIIGRLGAVKFNGPGFHCNDYPSR